jgi:hypothetical protein
VTAVFIPHKEIDKVRWDACVEAADNSLIYARSWFLDIVSPGWNALIENDYDAVMPLTHKSKYGIRYLTQPPFAQQLGVFGKKISEEQVKAFISELSRRYRFAEIHLNYQNALSEAKARTNFVLDLNRPYEEIIKGYTAENLRNLSKGARRGADFTSEVSVSEVISFYRAAYGDQNPQLGNEEYLRFEKLCSELEKRGMLNLQGIKTAEGQLCSAGCFMNDGERAIYVMGAANEEGRRLQATHFLLDGYIRKYAGQQMILDFEGSEIPGVNRFYRKFGPENQPFYQLRINKLPFPLNLLKR